VHTVRDLVTGCNSAVGEAIILWWYPAMVNVPAMQPMVLQRSARCSGLVFVEDAGNCEANAAHVTDNRYSTFERRQPRREPGTPNKRHG
jgi:hypothetical protein